MRYASGAREMKHRLQEKEKEKERDQHNTIDSLIIFYVNYDLWAIYTQIHNGSHFFFSLSVDSIAVSVPVWCMFVIFEQRIGFYFCFMDSPHRNWLQWEIIFKKKKFNYHT